jgi:hypothetical protein
MDTIFYYRLMDAVRDSLDRAGRHGYTLYRAENHEAWLDLIWLQEYLDERGHEAVPLHWEGRALCVHDVVKVPSRASERELHRFNRTGAILLRDDALVAAVTILSDDAVQETFVVVGECSQGALQRLATHYGEYSRSRARASPWITVIGKDPVPRPRGLTWDSLVLEPGLRDELRRQVDSFFAMAPEYERLKIPHRRGLLFAGPPGNGKTSALRIIASERPEPFFTFTLTKYSDRSEVDEAFDKAALEAPSILCFEDVDSLFQDNFGLSHFLNRIDGIHPLEGVLILATTNHPEQLDSALTERPSRFDRIFTFGNPGPEQRRQYLREGFGPAFDELLVDETDGFSMAQLKEVRVGSCLEAIQEALPGPTASAAIKVIRRLRGQRVELSNDWGPGRTIVGFQWSRTATSG